MQMHCNSSTQIEVPIEVESCVSNECKNLGMIILNICKFINICGNCVLSFTLFS